MSSGGCVGRVVCLCYVQYGGKVDHAFVEEGDKTVCIIFILHRETISLSKLDFVPHGKMQPVSFPKSHVRQSVALHTLQASLSGTFLQTLPDLVT